MKAYRGVDKFYVAEVLEDNETEIKYGVPYNVSAVQHVTREDPEESAKVYADNKAVIVVKGEGSPTATFTTLCLDPADLAKLLGHATKGSAMIATNRPKEKYFGIMYRLKNSDGSYEYVAIAKAKFNAPSEDVETENDGTDVTLMELSANLVGTVHEFEIDGVKSAYKYLKLKEEVGENFAENFFKEMQTPDTLDTVGGKVATPTASKDEGNMLTLTSETPGAKLYYTTDGSEPSETNGSSYTVPFSVADITTVKAIAYKDNYEPSDVLEYTTV